MKDKIKTAMAFAILGSVTSLMAQEAIQIGDLKISPYVGGDLTYDDNVNSSATKDEDVYASASAGIRASGSTDSAEWDSSGWVTERRYDQFDDKDAIRWGVAGLGTLKSDRSFVSGSLNFRRVEDYDEPPALGRVPTGFEGTVDQAFDRTLSNQDRRLYDATLGVGYLLTDKMHIKVGYKYYAVDYVDNLSQDWNENTLGLELASTLTDKTSGYIDLQYGFQDGDGAPDGADTSTVRLGVKNALSDKSTVRFGVGATRYTTDADEYTRPSYEANASWNATDKIQLFVNGRNEIQPTGIGNAVQLASRASSGVNYRFTDAWSFTASGALVYNKGLNGAKDVNGQQIGTIKASYSTGYGLSLFVKASYTDAFSDTSADYDRFKGSLGINYKF